MKLRLFKALGFALILSATTVAKANDCTVTHTDKDSLVIKPRISSKRNIVKLHPNPTFDGTITISSNIESDLHFYVFDMEATLLYRVTLKGKDKKVVPNLKKGIYTYDVFQNDESIERGEIIVK